MMTDPFPIGLDDPDDLEVAGFKPKHRQLEPPKRWGRPVRALLQREYDSVPAAGHQLVKGLRGLCGAAVGVLVALGLAAYFCSIIALAVYNSSSLLDPSSAPPDAASLPADAGALPARLPQAVLPSAADARWEDPGGPLPATTTARIEAWQGGGATSLSPPTAPPRHAPAAEGAEAWSTADAVRAAQRAGETSSVQAAIRAAVADVDIDATATRGAAGSVERERPHPSGSVL